MNDEGQSNVSVTLASYEERAEAYLQDSTSTSLPLYEEFLRGVVTLLPADSQMLELGSGPGRDALSSRRTALPCNELTAHLRSLSGSERADTKPISWR